MNEKFMQSMGNEWVVHDTRIMADFVRIYCDSHHGNQERKAVETDAAKLGAYGRKVPVLCAECESHLAYAETRRAHCPKDPKPFCAHCDSQCYKPDELQWQGHMMRYSGPRSWYQGHFVDGIRHAMEAREYRKQQATSEA